MYVCARVCACVCVCAREYMYTRYHPHTQTHTHTNTHTHTHTRFHARKVRGRACGGPHAQTKKIHKEHMKKLLQPRQEGVRVAGRISRMCFLFFFPTAARGRACGGPHQQTGARKRPGDVCAGRCAAGTPGQARLPVCGLGRRVCVPVCGLGRRV